MSEFKSNFCPSEQTPFLSQSAFLAKENNFYFGGKIKATEKIEGYNSSTCPIWHFYHQDHLGNTRVVTDDQGNVIAEHKYFPYGEELTSQTQDTLSHRLTGHERDFESNLDYMLARYYSSFMGRFLSIDKIRNKTKEFIKSWNLFIYANNNPIAFIDINGLESIYIAQTLGWLTQISFSGMKKSIENGTKYKVEIKNRASKSDIKEMLSKANKGDIVIIFGHSLQDKEGKMVGMQTNEFLLSTGVLTGSEIKNEIMSDKNPPSGLILGGCITKDIADKATKGTETTGVGTTEESALGFLATAIEIIATSLAEGNSLEEAVEQANEYLARIGLLAQFEVIPPERSETNDAEEKK
jgi:RHS repeat-associated protein